MPQHLRAKNRFVVGGGGGGGVEVAKSRAPHPTVHKSLSVCDKAATPTDGISIMLIDK